MILIYRRNFTCANDGSKLLCCVYFHFSHQNEEKKTKMRPTITFLFYYKDMPFLLCACVFIVHSDVQGSFALWLLL